MYATKSGPSITQVVLRLSLTTPQRRFSRKRPQTKRSLRQMRLRPIVHLPPLVRLREQHFNVIFFPVFRGQVLQERHSPGKIQGLQVRRPMDQKRSADVDVERWEVNTLRHVGVPDPDSGREVELSHQQTVHPAKRKLEEIDVLCFQMIMERSINSPNEPFQVENFTLDAFLCEGVVVLNAVEHARETVEGVSLDDVERCLVKCLDAFACNHTRPEQL
mmetsp:Transcript_17811/g.41951  ORF Transcript_17811/g.41951 Transcript_17811/m.41951 type:complete len:218 (-) Transcript_17811:898-1551(-)